MHLALFTLAGMVFPGALVAQGVSLASPAGGRTLMLANHHPLWANAGNDLGAMVPEQMLPQLTVVLARTAGQEAAFEQLLAEQQDPASPNYHRWLTPAEVGERFGPSSDQVAAVTAWLESAGLHVNWVAPSRIFIGFTGSAADVGRAFQTELHEYSVHGAKRFSVSSDPMVPAALAQVIRAVRGLYTVNEQPLHHFRALSFASPEVTDGGSHFMAPADFAMIYDLPGGLAGAGETIGIVGEARTDFADFSNFDNVTGAGVPNPTEIVPTAYGGIDPGAPFTTPPPAGTSTGDQGEATLDVLRTGSTAPQARLLLVVATSASGGVGDDAQYLVQTTPVPAQIMTISFGACESESGVSGVDFWDGLFQQAAAEGISVFVSSGDSGASGCDTSFITPPASPVPNSPNVICSSTYATCVGGTEFNDAADPTEYWSTTNNSNLASALGYIPEGGWNEPLDSESKPQVASSGGGVSKLVATPSWQTGTGVPSARAGRYTPDIAFSASGHDGYFGCFAAGGGSCVTTNGEFYFSVFSGTSAAAPSMAGIAALLDEYAGAAQGNLNPGIYATASVFPTAFHDVTVASSGVSSCSLGTPSMCNNSIPGTTGLTGGQAGYLVADGYDEVTGLGSLDVSTFVYNYTTSRTKITPTVVLTLSGQITTAQALDVLVSVAGGPNEPTPTGTVVLTSGSYTSATAAITNTSIYIDIPAGTLPIGSDPVKVTYTPDASSSATYTSASSTASVTVTLPPKIAPTLSITPSASIFTNTEALTVLTAVSGGSGSPTPTGSVTLTCGSYASAATPLANGAVTITVPAGSLPVGPDELTATYTPAASSSSTYTSASNFVPITNDGARIPPSVAFTLSAFSVTTAQALTMNITVNGGTGNPAPTGSVVVTSGSYSSAATALGGGVATVNIPAGLLAVGTDTLTVTYTPDSASSSMYEASYGSNTMTVTQAVPPSFAVSGATVTLYPGAATGNVSNVMITPSGGFTGSVALTAAITSSPAGAQDLPALSFGSTSPVSITGASAGTAELTITTTAASSAALRDPAERGRPWLAAGGTVLACLLFFWTPRRRRGWRTTLGMLALLATFTGSVLACSSVQGGGNGGGGGSNPGTTVGTYTVTVTGTSGSETQTGTVTLTVE